MPNLIWVLLGAALCVILGAVVGFWIEVLTYSPLTNGFYECLGC